ncbi:hypothetical protein I6J77_10515 [Rhodanobacter sp. FDAARGOS 1247]|uniref:hypothetical protein n=1 Tax=Rhodanobacter sp. FDAARGOS 1247 TaxID=2778082 RepID=UPI00194DCB4E|nr:hypothetical protein [Rhodanobacter sp. FDAARGOS 1247]QRP62573.1 hypothetical protein I6J77_10515 [Rhodanobacter sp. FDAARGOS 1247]
MEISSQKQLRSHGTPAFCYLCGETLAGPSPINRDHCPPKGLFALGDRENYPIILPTHVGCNDAWKEADEMIGIITDALHTRKKSQSFAYTDRLKPEFVSFGIGHAASVSNLPLAPMAARIVRGMHALLYKDFLPVRTKSKFHIPLPEAEIDTLRLMVPLEQTFVFSDVIRKALLSKTADVVRAYNGKFKYACTWERADNGQDFCIACFDIYTFHEIAPPVTNFPKSFVGMYIPDRQPAGASRASGLEIQLTHSELLDPWQQTE